MHILFCFRLTNSSPMGTVDDRERFAYPQTRSLTRPQETEGQKRKAVSSGRKHSRNLEIGLRPLLHRIDDGGDIVRNRHVRPNSRLSTLNGDFNTTLAVPRISCANVDLRPTNSNMGIGKASGDNDANGLAMLVADVLD